MNTIYVAFETRAVDDWEDRVVVPEYPTFKPDTRERKQQEFRDGYDAADALATAVTTRVAYRLDASNDIVLSAQDFASYAAATVALDAPLRVIGIDLQHALRICAWSATGGTATPPPIWFWDCYRLGPECDVQAINLYSMSGAKAAGIALDAWLRLWDYDLGMDWKALDVQAQLTMIVQLAHRMGF